MASRLWTCEQDIPAEYRVDGFLLEPVDATPGTNNQIAFAPDRWGVRPMGQATAANQIYRGDREGHPAFVWPNTRGNRGLQPNDPVTLRYVAFVMAYNDAALSGFLGFPHIISDGNLNTRVMGNNGRATLSTDRVAVSQVSKNCGALTATILPMGMCLIEIFLPAATVRWGLIGNSQNSWQGPMWFVVGLGLEPTAALRSKIQGYLMHRFTLQAQMPADHEFRNAPPMVQEAVVVEARGRAVVPRMRAGGRGRHAVGARGGAEFRLGADGRTGLRIAARARVAVEVGAQGGAGVGITARGGAGLPIGGAGRAGLAVGARGSSALRLLASGAAAVLDAPIVVRGRIATAGQSRSSTLGNDGRTFARGDDGRRFTRVK